MQILARRRTCKYKQASRDMAGARASAGFQRHKGDRKRGIWRIPRPSAGLKTHTGQAPKGRGLMVSEALRAMSPP